MWIRVLTLKQRLHLIWGSFENTATLIDGVSQQAVFLALHLFCSPVHRFGDQTSLRDVALEKAEEEKKKSICIHTISLCLVSEYSHHIQVGVLRTTPHHAIPSQEVGDDLFVNVVHQTSCTLVVVSSINEELLTCVLINQGADLKPRVIREHESNSRLTCSEL